MTETIILPPSGDFKLELEDDHASYCAPSQASIAVRSLMMKIQRLFDSWKMKGENKVDFKLSHSEIGDEVEIKITASKWNFALFDPPPPPTSQPAIIIKTEKPDEDNLVIDHLNFLIPLQQSDIVKTELDTDDYEFYEIVEEDSPSIINVHHQTNPVRRRRRVFNQQPTIMYKCRYCNKSYKALGNLNNHEKTHIGFYQPRFVIPPKKIINECEVCDLQFTSRRAYYEHLKWHKETNTNRFACKLCNYSTMEKFNLTTHNKNKHNEKVFQCDLCDRRYAIKRTIVDHMESFHLRKRVYFCQYCGKTYASQAALYTHTKFHTTGKIVQCDLCEHRTCTKDKMKKHMTKHSKIRNYCCDLCGKTFLDPSCVRDHKLAMHFGGMKTVHGEPLKCIFCRKVFKMMRAVREHIRNVHHVTRKIETEEIMNFK